MVVSGGGGVGGAAKQQPLGVTLLADSLDLVAEKLGVRKPAGERQAVCLAGSERRVEIHGAVRWSTTRDNAAAW